MPRILTFEDWKVVRVLDGCPTRVSYVRFTAEKPVGVTAGCADGSVVCWDLPSFASAPGMLTKKGDAWQKPFCNTHGAEVHRQLKPPLRRGDVTERRLAKFRRNVARFRLYRLRFLQENMRFAAFFKIYTILKLKFLKFEKILQILRHLQFFC